MASNEKNNKNKTKVLIIEDEQPLSDLLNSKLKKEGYEVQNAYDGKEGYKKLKSFDPDLILLDIIMPKMDGYEVMEKMNEEKRNTPVIVISNSGQPVEIEKTKKLGAVDHLIKTEFSPSDVLEKVNNYLSGKTQKKNKKSSAKVTKPSPKEDAPKNDITILLVEDESFLRKMASKQLAKEGFSVYGAEDGEQGLKTFKESHPDIVLLDIILPSMDGFQVLEKIRNHDDKKLAQTPIIMLSNLGQDSDIEKAKKLGANDFMVKANFTSKEIADKIKEFFGDKKDDDGKDDNKDNKKKDTKKKK